MSLGNGDSTETVVDIRGLIGLIDLGLLRHETDCRE